MGYVWDLLRPVDKVAVNFDLYITGIVLIVSLVLFAIAIMAYKKNQTKRFLLIAGAFFLFFLKWLLKATDIFFSPGLFFSLAAQDTVELITMILLFFALFWKK
jgi:hypothetical protein